VDVLLVEPHEQESESMQMRELSSAAEDADSRRDESTPLIAQSSV
jgi:hypothetical protein